MNSNPRSQTKAEFLKAAGWVAAAALIWALDNLLRYPASVTLPAEVLVFSEHLVSVLVLLPWVVVRHRTELTSFRKKDLWAIAVVGVGGAALAGFFYTRGIRLAGPVTTSVIQKLQPLIVGGLAYGILKERFRRWNFFPWAYLALLSAILVSFPKLEIHSNILHDDYWAGFFYAFLAMSLWGFATVGGKFLLYHYSPTVVAFVRYLVSTVFLGFWIGLEKISISWSIFTTGNMGFYLLVMGTVIGAVPMVFYYIGLKRLPANLVTFIELLYPIGSLILIAIFLEEGVSGIQWLAGGLLIVSLLMLVIPKQDSLKDPLEDKPASAF